jgi:hypothetical protein
MQFLAILLMLVAGEEPALRPGDHWRSLEVDGAERTYLVHVPAHHDPAAGMPPRTTSTTSPSPAWSSTISSASHTSIANESLPRVCRTAR